MFDRNSYREDCARLTLGQEKIQEMITMTENKKKKFFGHPARVAVLAAALAACLGITAFAASPAGQEMIQGIFVTFTYVEQDGDHYTISLNGELGNMDNFGVVNVTVLPTMSYEERDGRQILILDGEELDVTEAMEKDGFYERELERGTLRVMADGTATITMDGEDGAPSITHTVYLNEDGADLIEGELGDVDFEVSGDAEITGFYTFTSEGSFTATDYDGNIVVVSTDDLPE